mmetsp:Transcript_13563/g.41013  ORF Transcript_13563/g.41013 Transcript_13563/m.41013 type:complete len:164 (-) Transcript_13563:489-980(-)|eukprot:CAMPEP_0206140090 /NCGR_PEP_ID=MMETSP1473-20131121/8297_1 /ASSEMBLY_ACC=CAM_ASM_001109 /TAXON_ID=1461547 /ORGANISM="Stichococcus sp, Strain RCC1054" /LENGTH=163 /DNA_ID=CAMNT_0053534101 /DNA_START=136 /DNA_END=627 /DNA_ORIENTATION=-
MLSRLKIAGKAVSRAGPEVSRAWAAHWAGAPPLDQIEVRPKGFCSDVSPSPIKELKSDAEYQAVVKAAAEDNASSVIQFTAAWCGPCRMIAPVLEQLSRDYGDQATFYKVDIDNDAIAATVGAAGVTGVPTFTFLRGTQRIAQFSGADRNALKNHVVNLIAMG